MIDEFFAANTPAPSTYVLVNNSQDFEVIDGGQTGPSPISSDSTPSHPASPRAFMTMASLTVTKTSSRSEMPRVFACGCDHGLPLATAAGKNPLRKEINKLAASLIELGREDAEAA